jgi:hypothetical protein
MNIRKRIAKNWACQVSQPLLIAVIGSVIYPTAIAAIESSQTRPTYDAMKEAADDFSGSGRPGIQGAGGTGAIDFSGSGRPGNQSAGGSRGECPDTEIPLTVLMPDSNFGLTTTEQPTLWFYLPYTADEVAFGLFSLQTATGEDVGEPLDISLPSESPGFVSLTLPESLKLETLETDYRWYLELYCGEDDSPAYVSGWLQQVEPTPELSRQLADEKIASDTAYANATIWYDAISVIASLRTEDPDNADLLERWTTLLTANGVTLDDLPPNPFAGEILIEASE